MKTASVFTRVLQLLKFQRREYRTNIQVGFNSFFLDVCCLLSPKAGIDTLCEGLESTAAIDTAYSEYHEDSKNNDIHRILFNLVVSIKVAKLTA